MPRKKSVLTETQKAAADKMLTGVSASDAFGCAKLSREEEIQSYLSTARAEITNATTLNRLDVIDGILEAINIAKLMSEPATMITGYTQLAKIMGFVAPEAKKLDITINGARLRSKMESLSDEELLALTDGTALIEGESIRVGH